MKREYEDIYAKIMLRVHFTMLLAGALLGHTVSEFVYRHPGKYTSTIDFVIVVSLFVPMVFLQLRSSLEMRRWRRLLKAERDTLLAQMKARVDEVESDPIRAARIKMEMEAQWLQP